VAPHARGAASIERPALSATVATSSVVVPLDIVAFVSCANGGAGEEVAVSGNLHVLTHTTLLESGKVTAKSHFQPQGVAGVGAETGDIYRATGVTQDMVVLNGNPPLSTTFVNNFRIIGPGPGNNFTAHQVVHITVNAKGEVTATVDAGKTECS
jgi:hypothetical protein